ARQVEARGSPGGVLGAISTSGRSPNLLRAVDAAREAGMCCVALSGRGGGPLARAADVSLVVPSDDTQRVQEVHGLVIHILCELVEDALCRETRARPPAGRLRELPPRSAVANGRAHVPA